MAQAFECLSKKHIVFLEAQPCFFMAKVAADGRVKVSPKGLESLRIISPTRVMWLNITGSGNGNAAHIHELPRMMLVLSSFSGSALTLRLCGAAECLQPGNIGWEEALSSFPGLPAARQIFYLIIDRVQTSRGFSVPEMKIVRYRAEDELVLFCDKMSDEKPVAY